ncbi:PPE family protein [Mycobacterium szulgai]|nr:PPE family protein [Mycobacterium szulgai]MCV7077680.1 PPE family protein [Mycobacterium szulgai]
MNFTVFPPEVNSGLIWAGPGSAPMLATATAWDTLSSELASAAGSFRSTISELAEQAWQGAAAQAMTRVAETYAAWLTAATGQAELASSRAKAIADVFETARAATIHPAVVAANRSELVSLVVSNLFGQNAPAIAAAEAGYEEIWAQDVAAMSGYYAQASAAVASLSPWQAVSAVSGLSAGAKGIYIYIPFLDGTINLTLGNVGLSPGVGNIGNLNLGSGNVGDFNLGTGNFGTLNLGSGNGSSGKGDSAAQVPGSFNLGSGNIGSYNLGSGNLGN